MKRTKKEKQRPTLLESEVGDFVNGRAVAVHEGEELIQEQLLLRVREPAALTAHLHAAHHVLLRETPSVTTPSQPRKQSSFENAQRKRTFILSIQESDWLEVGESLPSRPLLLRGRPRRLRDGHPAEKQTRWEVKRRQG